MNGTITQSEAKLSEKASRIQAIKYLHLGDPFPFIRHEWPSLIITDPAEKAEFEKHLLRKTDKDLRIDDFQYDAILSVFNGRHTQLYLSGGTKLGKGLIVGGIIVNIWYSLYQESCKIILVGPTTNHLKRNLFGEACKWRAMMSSYISGDEPCEILKESIEDPANKAHLIVLANTDSGEGMSGNHSLATLFVFDESSGVPDDHYNQALSQCKFLIAISNPRMTSGWFHRGFPADFDSGSRTVNATTGPRRIISIGGIHCLNVRARKLMSNISPIGGMEICGKWFDEGKLIPLEYQDAVKPLIPGQVCYDLRLALEASRPKDEVLWAVYGKFPQTNKEFMLFSSAWRSCKKGTPSKDIDISESVAIGFDVAASINGDYTSIAFGNTLGCKEIFVDHTPNLMDLKGHFYALCRNRGIDPQAGFVPIAIDSIGVGKGLADALEADGCLILRVENGRAAEHNKEQYHNRRAEVYGELAQAMDPTLNEKPFTIPDDQSLWEELLAVEKIYTPTGRQFKIIPKRRPPAQKSVNITDNRQSMEEKIGRSPDKADSVTLLYQAVQLLPEYGPDSMSQFNPSKVLKKYEVEERGLLKTYICHFMDGTTVDYSEREFVELFGRSPMTYDYEEAGRSYASTFRSSAFSLPGGF